MKEMISIKLLKGKHQFHHHRDYLLVLNLANQCAIEMDQEQFSFPFKGMMLLNPFSNISISGDCFLIYVIDMGEFCQLFGGMRYQFFLNSSLEYNNNYECLLEKLLKLVSKKEEESLFSKVEYRQLENEILIFLVDNFAINDGYETNDKIQEVVDYIDLHCIEDIRLKEISSHFGFTPQYFARFFKEKMGINLK